MQNIADIQKPKRPIRVLQYGEGNFLRGFVDYMLDVANEKGVMDAGIAIVKPIPFGNLDAFQRQNSNYTVLLRGVMDGETVVERRPVTSVESVLDCAGDYAAYMELAKEETLELVVSNTTEAGIVYEDGDKLEDMPPKTYPAKLTQFLYARYTHFAGAEDKGLVVLPVELIEYNGQRLLECVKQYAALWQLPAGFSTWLDNANLFCDTLVDRIVTGYPKEEAEALWAQWGYQDDLIVTGEPFALWVIQSDRLDSVKKVLPLDKAGLPVVFTQNLRPYRERKVRILNGGHTGMVLGAYLAGLDTVGECMQDPDVSAYLRRMVYDEIVPTVDLPKEEVKAFADAVMERFSNPFIRHKLLDISLNSVSKWKARVLPSFMDSLSINGQVPPLLTFSFAALLAFYTGSEMQDGTLTGHRQSPAGSYTVRDDADVLAFFAEYSQKNDADFVQAAASKTDFWSQDLSLLPGFCEKTTAHLAAIRQQGARAAIRAALG